MTPEKRTVVRMTPDLFKFMSNSPSTISSELLARNLIAEELDREVSGLFVDKAIRKIINCVSGKISNRPDVLVEFVEVLSGINDSGYIIEDLRKVYCEFS